MSDHPDWTDSNVIASQSQVLFDNGIGAALPLSQQVDSSLFASIDIALRFSGVGSSTPAVLYVQWLINSVVVADDIITCWSGFTDPFSSADTFSLPAKGDTCWVRVLFAPGGLSAGLT